MTAPDQTVDAALAKAAHSGVARLDAHLLLGQVLQRTRSWLLAHGDHVLAPAAARAVDALLQRRAAGEPLAYLVGEKEFHGLMLNVTPDVLIPRPETELLVDWGIELLEGPLRMRPAPTVVDLGTGSGAVALAIKLRASRASVVGLDRSTAALAVAAANAERHGLPVRFLRSDWWNALAGAGVDLALANPPYIAEGDVHLPALRFEPAEALVAGADGLEAYMHIVADAPAHLAAGGWLVFEHGSGQAEAVAGLLRRHGFVDIQSRRDLAGQWRCSGGRRGS